MSVRLAGHARGPEGHKIISFPSILWGYSNKHKTPQFILEKRGALLDSIAMGIAPDI